MHFGMQVGKRWFLFDVQVAQDFVLLLEFLKLFDLVGLELLEPSVDLMDLGLLGGKEILLRHSLLPGIRVAHCILIEDGATGLFIALIVDGAPTLDVN
jgi:hypothetical protein